MRYFLFLKITSLCLLATAVLVARSDAEDQPESRAAQLRRDLSSSRRVGYLRRRRDETSEEDTFVLKDAYDKSTYRILEEPGLDLASFVDRYVSLQGETKEAGSDRRLRFAADSVTALDDQEPATARATNVRPAAFEADEARPLERRDEPAEVRVAALTDGLPAPSEVIEQIQPPLAVEIETAPESYVVEEPATGFEPVTGFGWLRPPVTPINATGRAWARGEFLLWLTDTLRTPSLITTSPTGTPRATAGVLGEPGTTGLYGASTINNDPHVGGRLQGGYWWNADNRIATEGEFFMLDEQSSQYFATSTGDPILARPYYDILNGQETSELVAYPDVLRGSVQAIALTNVASLGLWMRFDPHGTGSPCEVRSGRKLNWVVGYRHMRLDDSLAIREDLESLDTTNPGTFLIQDGFRTKNRFNGIEFGAIYEANRGRLFIEALSKIAVGNNHQTVDISGFSDITEMGLLERYPVGILAQRTNSGSFSRDELALVPQLGLTLGWRVSPRFSVTAGYTLVYFSNVVRAGDQIDRDVNKNLFPPEVVPLVGALRPEFAWRESDFWAHGLSFGGDFRW